MNVDFDFLQRFGFLTISHNVSDDKVECIMTSSAFEEICELLMKEHDIPTYEGARWDKIAWDDLPILERDPYSKMWRKWGWSGRCIDSLDSYAQMIFPSGIGKSETQEPISFEETVGFDKQ